MKNILLLIVSLNMTLVLANDKKPELVSLFRSLVPSASSTNSKVKLTVSGCKNYDPKWMGLLLFKEPFTAKYVFNKKCDIQGKLNIKEGTSFPVLLKLKNFENYDQVKMDLILKSIMQEMSVELTVNNGILNNKKNKTFFSGLYKVKLKVASNKIAVESETGSIKFYEDASQKKVIATEIINGLK